MAGSFSHIVDPDTGKFTMELIENLGDAHEALEECYIIIKSIMGTSKSYINLQLMALDLPSIKHDLTDF